MNIGFVTFEYPPFVSGGAGIYAANLTRELALLGHQVVVFTPLIKNLPVKSEINETNNPHIRGIRINRKLPWKALLFWMYLPTAVREAEGKNRFDVIHFNGVSYWFLKKKISEAPHIVTIHHLVRDATRGIRQNWILRIRDIGGEAGFVIPLIERRCITSADQIVAVSDFTRKRISEIYKVSPNKIEAINNGVDLKVYNFAEQELLELKRQLGLSASSVILFVGRVDDPRKGLDVLLKAFKRVLQKFDAMLLVVGGGDQKEARKFVQSLGIPENVIFAGFADGVTLRKCYALCNVYVCSSRMEGFGLTVLEAMAAARPIVATNVGGLPELIQSEENGILVEPDNEVKLADAIIQLLSNDSFARVVGDNNIRKVQQLDSWKAVAQKVERLYSGLAK